MRPALPTDPSARLDLDDELPDGAWLDELLEGLPELSALPRDRAVEMVLADFALLDRALGRLPAGRLPAELVAGLVRLAAQCHIARRLESRRRSADRFRNWPTTGWRALSDRVNLRRRSLADRQGDAARLYAALRPHLRHAWQVPLLPLYARMTPDLVQRLGPRLLELRQADALAAVLD